MTFLLRLNDMRTRAEDLVDVAVGESVEALQAWLDSHKVEPYDDTNPEPGAGGVIGDDLASSGARFIPARWHKTFAKGSPLEWYNPPYLGPLAPPNVLRIPTREDMARMAEETFVEMERRLSPLPRVS